MSTILDLGWRAIASASDTGFASLVASGTVTDRITITPDAMPIIERRRFTIENMALPELMRPRPLPASQPRRTNQTSQRKSIMRPFSQTDGADIDMKPISSRPLPSFSFPSSAPSARPPDATPADPSPFLDDERRPLKPQEKLIQLLRSSQNVISFVVGFSAMMASTQPLVDPSNHVAGITLAAIGIGSASVSMAGLIIAKVIIMLETTIVKDELTVDMIDKS